MGTPLYDLRYAARTLVKSPGFTIPAVLTLALGIGANTTIFTLVDAVLLRPPAHIAEPERLVYVYTSDFSGPLYGASSYPDFEAFRTESGALEGAALFAPRVAAVGEGVAVERVGMEVVSAEYFRVLGVRPAAGRFFLDEEGATPGAAPVVVISQGLWERRFGGDPDAVGRPLVVNGRPYTVVGVAPEGFRGSLRGFQAEVWASAMMAAPLGLGDGFLISRGDRGSFVVARLAPGVTRASAQASMDLLAGSLHAAYPDFWTDVRDEGRKITLVQESAARVPPMVRGPVLGFLGLLGGTVALVLLICCANVAGLLLARATGRFREIGIRLSLGASRGRLIRQMLTESLLLAGLGAALGALLSAWAAGLLTAVELPIPAPVGLDLKPDARVLAFTVGITVVAALAFGLAPALRASRPALLAALRNEANAVVAGRRRINLRGALVVGQVAVSLVLLTGALLFLRGLRSAAAIDPGFRAENVLLVPLEALPGSGAEGEAAQVAETLRERIAGLPGVESVSWGSAIPLGGTGARRWMQVEGYQPGDGEDMEFHFNVVGSGYFDLMDVPLVRGRGFGEADREGAPGVVIVNEAFARRFWPGEDPIGRRLRMGGGPDAPAFEVVGLARTGKYLSLSEEPRPYIFLSGLQTPPFRLNLHVRTAGEPEQILAAVRGEVAALAPQWSIVQPRPLEDQIGTSLLPQRIAGGVLGLFGVVALGLAALGLYSVVAYAVAARTREIGVRIALGARAGDVVGLVVRQGMMLVAVGAAVGLPLAFGASRLLGGMLIGVGPGDPMAYAGAPLILATAALVASWVPARRATRVDPMAALRAE